MFLQNIKLFFLQIYENIFFFKKRSPSVLFSPFSVLLLSVPVYKSAEGAKKGRERKGKQTNDASVQRLLQKEDALAAFGTKAMKDGSQKEGGGRERDPSLAKVWSCMSEPGFSFTASSCERECVLRQRGAGAKK